MYPSGEKDIVKWGVAGVSLGGHSAWQLLCSGEGTLRVSSYMYLHRPEPRISLGVPIIGCPDYLRLMAMRAASSSVDLRPPAMPDSLRAIIQRSDPLAFPYKEADKANPFLGKKILVLAGRKDTEVPFSASKDFVDGLEVGVDGIKEVFVDENAGHECSEDMIERIAIFVREHFLDQISHDFLS